MADERKPLTEPVYLRPNRVRLMLGVSQWTLNRLIRDEGLECVKITERKRCFDPEVLAAWMRARKRYQGKAA